MTGARHPSEVFFTPEQFEAFAVGVTAIMHADRQSVNGVLLDPDGPALSAVLCVAWSGVLDLLASVAYFHGSSIADELPRWLASFRVKCGAD